MSSSADEYYHSDIGGDPSTTEVTNETPGGSDTNPFTETPISDKPPTETDQNPVAVDNPLSDTSNQDLRSVSHPNRQIWYPGLLATNPVISTTV